ncbi:MAG: glutathione S-transferase family protein [Pseudomonadota bacterium]
MKLAVSSWSPYQHQAQAFLQLIDPHVIEMVPLEAHSMPIHDKAVGPFIVLLDETLEVPALGLPCIAEVLHRRHPEYGLLPEDPVDRARTRAFSCMIEEQLSRFCVSGIKSHAHFDRPIWQEGSAAPSVVLESPPAFSALERHCEAKETFTYLCADHPTITDALMAALWWTIEDQSRLELLSDAPSLWRWHSRACQGSPFQRA